MTTNTDPVRALIGQWRVAAEFFRGDAGSDIRETLRACARELEAALAQQPAAPSGEAVLGALKDVCAMHLLMLAADDREGATQMVGGHNMRAAAWRLRSDCVLPQEQAKDKIMEKLSAALALAFGDWGLE